MSLSTACVTIGVGGTECARIRERDVEIIQERRTPPPQRWLASVHLGKEEVRNAALWRSAHVGAAAIDLPEPQAEYRDVGEPDLGGREDQLSSATPTALEQIVHEQSLGREVRRGHDCDQPDRHAPANGRLGVVAIRRRDHQHEQQNALEAGQQPAGTDRQPARQRHVQPNRYQYRELGLPERLNDAQLRVARAKRAEPFRYHLPSHIRRAAVSACQADPALPLRRRRGAAPAERESVDRAADEQP